MSQRRKPQPPAQSQLDAERADFEANARAQGIAVPVDHLAAALAALREEMARLKRPVLSSEIARRMGVGLSTATFWLDRLVADGRAVAALRDAKRRWFVPRLVGTPPTRKP